MKLIVFSIFIFLSFSIYGQMGGKDDFKTKSNSVHANKLYIDSLVQNLTQSVKYLILDSDNNEVRFTPFLLGEADLTITKTDSLKIDSLSQAAELEIIRYLVTDTLGNVKYVPSVSGGGGGLIYDFELSESLTQGDIVQLLEDGRIEGISEIAINENITDISLSSYSSLTKGLSIKKIPSSEDKFLVVYVNSSNQIYCNLMTISSSSITLGTAVYVDVVASHLIKFVKAAFVETLNENKFVIAYPRSGSSNYGAMIVGIIENETITLGSYSIFNTYNTTEIYDITFDPFNPYKFIIVYQGSSLRPYVRSGEISTSGLSYSVGVQNQLNTSSTGSMSVSVDPFNENRALIAFNQSLGDFYLHYYDISNDTYSLVDSYTFSGPDFNKNGVSCDIEFIKGISNRAVLVIGAGLEGQSLHLTYVGINESIQILNSGFISFFDGLRPVLAIDNNGVDFATSSTGSSNTNYSFFVKKFNIISDSTVLDTSIKFANGTIISETAIEAISNGRYVFGGAYQNANYYLGVSQFESSESNINYNNIVGILQQSGSSTDILPVSLLGGIDDNQSNLIIGAIYYLQEDGSITQDVSGFPLGKAISTSAILMFPLKN